MKFAKKKAPFLPNKILSGGQSQLIQEIGFEIITWNPEKHKIDIFIIAYKIYYKSILAKNARKNAYKLFAIRPHHLKLWDLIDQIETEIENEKKQIVT